MASPPLASNCACSHSHAPQQRCWLCSASAAARSHTSTREPRGCLPTSRASTSCWMEASTAVAGVANATAVANANTKTAAALQLGCARDPRPMAAFLWRGHLQMCNTKPHTTPQRHHLQFGTRCECELRLEIAAHVLSQPGLRGKKLANGDNDHHKGDCVLHVHVTLRTAAVGSLCDVSCGRCRPGERAHQPVPQSHHTPPRTCAVNGAPSASRLT